MQRKEMLVEEEEMVVMRWRARKWGIQYNHQIMEVLEIRIQIGDCQDQTRDYGQHNNMREVQQMQEELHHMRHLMEWDLVEEHHLGRVSGRDIEIHRIHRMNRESFLDKSDFWLMVMSLCRR
jgi:hypothetical protein